MAFECLNYERKDATCYLTLNRPDKLNALNAQLLGELRDALEIIELDPEIRVVILTGAGRAFSAGFDLDRGSGGVPPQGDEPDVRRRHLKSHIDTFMMVWNLSKPVIAAVNGFALAGACELVQICDIKIASDRAVLGEPEIRAGVGPPLLITPFSVGLARSKELLLTGDTIDAHEAARIGMVSRVVAPRRLDGRVRKSRPQDLLAFPDGCEDDQDFGQPGTGRHGVPVRHQPQPGADDSL